MCPCNLKIQSCDKIKPPKNKNAFLYSIREGF